MKKNNRIKPSSELVKNLEEEDEELLSKDELEDDNTAFQEEANFLKRLMKKFKKL